MMVGTTPQRERGTESVTNFLDANTSFIQAGANVVLFFLTDSDDQSAETSKIKLAQLQEQVAQTGGSLHVVMVGNLAEVSQYKNNFGSIPTHYYDIHQGFKDALKGLTKISLRKYILEWDPLQKSPIGPVQVLLNWDREDQWHRLDDSVDFETYSVTAEAKVMHDQILKGEPNRKQGRTLSGGTFQHVTGWGASFTGRDTITFQMEREENTLPTRLTVYPTPETSELDGGFTVAYRYPYRCDGSIDIWNVDVEARTKNQVVDRDQVRLYRTGACKDRHHSDQRYTEHSDWSSEALNEPAGKRTCWVGAIHGRYPEIERLKKQPNGTELYD